MSRSRAWLALALLPLLAGCVGALALPLMAGGGLMAVTKHRVRAATPVPHTKQTKKSTKSKAGSKPGPEAAAPSSTIVLTPLKELPPPSGAPEAAAAAAPWQAFFDYVRQAPPAKDGIPASPQSALLQQPPSLIEPQRQPCLAPVPAVVIDLDTGSQAFAPEHLAQAPADVAGNLMQLRQAGIVVLWISQLPSSRAADVSHALQAAGWDPQAQDQLLLVRNDDDRKQLLRQDASKDVCVVAIAGDQRGDFDELFDYLRTPDSAVGLEPMIGKGWFLVPPLDAPAPAAE